MPRNRKSIKPNPRISVKVKIQKPKAIQNPKSEQHLRCKDWIKSQNQEYSNDKSSNENTIYSTITSEISETFEKIPASTDSLSVLRKISRKDIHQSTLYGCEWENCGKEFEIDTELIDHVSSHIIDLKVLNDHYNCLWDLCNFSTQCNAEITRHIHYHSYHTKLKTIGESISRRANFPRCTNDSKSRNTVPELKDNFICRWKDCTRSFLSIILFCRHVQNHCISLYEQLKSIKSRKFVIPCGWENCEMEFTIKYRLVEHIRKHTGEKVVGCYQCGSLFMTNTIFLDHCKRQPANNTQEYQCAQCFKYFASERLLRSHVLTHVNCFKCSLCDMTCNSPYGLARHVRYRHISDRPIQCTDCDKRFVCKSDLEQHIQGVHKKKVYECGEPECNFVAKSISALRRHDSVVHGNHKIIYACHCCDNTYKRGTKLSKHLINAHNFQLPSGHQRFMYRMNEDGFYRLQTMRIESLEVTKQILSPRVSKVDDHFDNNSCSEISESYKLHSESINTSACITINDSSTDQFIFEYKDD